MSTVVTSIERLLADCLRVAILATRAQIGLHARLRTFLSFGEGRGWIRTERFSVTAGPETALKYIAPGLDTDSASSRSWMAQESYRPVSNTVRRLLCGCSSTETAAT
jgi:hypothetical protein